MEKPSKLWSSMALLTAVLSSVAVGTGQEAAVSASPAAAQYKMTTAMPYGQSIRHLALGGWSHLSR